jgi:glutaredoxin-like YruB-family protein
MCIRGVLMAKVIVYSTTTCPYCVMAKQWLKDKKVEFDDINVGIDQEKAREMIKKSGQMGVPVIDVDGEIIIGFDRPKLDASLKKKNLA